MNWNWTNFPPYSIPYLRDALLSNPLMLSRIWSALGTAAGAGDENTVRRHSDDPGEDIPHPGYILTTQYYHLYNNIFALFIPSGLSVFNMFVVRNSFRAVPRELIEAATIDGASNFQIFTRIAIPLAKVGMVTIGLFTALGYWNDFSLSLYLITNSELYPVQKMLYSMMCNISFLTAGGVDASVVSNVVLPNNTAKMVLTVLTVLPVVLVFPFAQRYFVKGMTVGAVKG